METSSPHLLHDAFRDPDYWIWCGSAIQGDDGRYHLFASRWPKTLTFGHWATASQIVRASADYPEGPYRFEEVVIGPRERFFWDSGAQHNPAIRKHGDTYLLFYVATQYAGDHPTTPDDGGLFSDKWLDSWNHKRPGVAIAKSIFGPWKRCDEPILLPRPGEWDAAITSNPAPWIEPDGRLTLIYKSADVPHPPSQYPGRFHLGVAQASPWTEPLVRLSGDPIQIAGHPDHHVEDGFLWKDDKGFHLIAKDMTGEICGETQSGILAHSQDALIWQLAAPPLWYSRTVKRTDGETVTFAKRERPHLMFTTDPDGQPATYLFTAMMQRGGDGQPGESWSGVARV